MLLFLHCVHYLSTALQMHSANQVLCCCAVHPHNAMLPMLLLLQIQGNTCSQTTSHMHTHKHAQAPTRTPTNTAPRADGGVACAQCSSLPTAPSVAPPPPPKNTCSASQLPDSQPS
jgi:hypothetical protein